MALTVRRLAVEVFGETMLFHGVINSPRRLTDVANEAEPFLNLQEIDTYPYRGDVLIGLGRRTQGLINKDSIVMLAERDVEQQENPASAEMRVTKVATRILVYTNHFAVRADIHLPEGGELRQFLEASPGQFVPVTNATVSPMEKGTQLLNFERHFMLINRDHIHFLGLAAEASADAAPTTGERSG